MSVVSEKVTQTSQRHIERWMRCKESVDSAKSRLNTEQCALRNAEIALVKFMLPDDAKPKEKFYIWFSDGLLACWVDEGGSEYAQWRKRPSKGL